MAAKKSAGKLSASTSNFDLDSAPGHLLRRAQQYAHDLFVEAVGADGLTPRQFAVLITVHQNEGLNQTDLVNMTGIDRSTLADMISRLIKKGLLSRKRTLEDARANTVKITAAGNKVLKSSMARVAKAEEAVLSPVPVSKRAEFLKNLSLIAEATSEAEAAQRTIVRPAPAPKRKTAAKKTAAKRKSAPKRKTAAKRKSR